MGPSFESLVSDQGADPVSEYVNRASFDGHLRIYPTLRCNLRCPYCVNMQMGVRPKNFPSAAPDRWIEAINREKRHVVFTGGEPFLYPGLAEVINGIDADLKIRVYSNFCMKIRPTLDILRRRVHFFLSWHPQERADRELFLANVLHMYDNPLFTAIIHAIDTPETQDALKDDLRFFSSKGLAVTIDVDQRDFEGSCQPSLSRAVCSKTIYLVAPDGTRYQCVSRLVRGDRPLENMLQKPLGPEEALDVCPDYGNCAPCDALGQTRMAVFERL